MKAYLAKLAISISCTLLWLCTKSSLLEASSARPACFLGFLVFFRCNWSLGFWHLIRLTNICISMCCLAYWILFSNLIQSRCCMFIKWYSLLMVNMSLVLLIHPTSEEVIRNSLLDTLINIVSSALRCCRLSSANCACFWSLCVFAWLCACVRVSARCAIFYISFYSENPWLLSSSQPSCCSCGITSESVMTSILICFLVWLTKDNWILFLFWCSISSRFSSECLASLRWRLLLFTGFVSAGDSRIHDNCCRPSFNPDDVFDGVPCGFLRSSKLASPSLFVDILFKSLFIDLVSELASPSIFTEAGLSHPWSIVIAGVSRSKLSNSLLWDYFLSNFSLLFECFSSPSGVLSAPSLCWICWMRSYPGGLIDNSPSSPDCFLWPFVSREALLSCKLLSWLPLFSSPFGAGNFAEGVSRKLASLFTPESGSTWFWKLPPNLFSLGAFAKIQS